MSAIPIVRMGYDMIFQFTIFCAAIIQTVANVCFSGVAHSESPHIHVTVIAVVRLRHNVVFDLEVTRESIPAGAVIITHKSVLLDMNMSFEKRTSLSSAVAESRPRWSWKYYRTVRAAL